MSTELAPSKPTENVKLREWMNRPEIHDELAAAVGDSIDADRFLAHMLTAFQDPKIRACTDASKFTALHECAAMGLLPTLDQVRLIPYKTHLKAMPQWQGYKALMERHPDILEVTGHLVHYSDDFTVKNNEVSHTFDPFDPERDINSAKDIRGGYCKITYRDGRPPKYHFVPVRHIEKARKCAQTQDIWNAWYEQMAMKTLYRDCYQRRAVPVDPLVQRRLERTLLADDLSLGNDPTLIEGPPVPSHIEQAKAAKQAREATQEPQKPAPEPPPVDESKVEPAAEEQPQEPPEEAGEPETTDEVETLEEYVSEAWESLSDQTKAAFKQSYKAKFETAAVPASVTKVEKAAKADARFGRDTIAFIELFAEFKRAQLRAE